MGQQIVKVDDDTVKIVTTTEQPRSRADILRERVSHQVAIDRLDAMIAVMDQASQ